MTEKGEHQNPIQDNYKDGQNCQKQLFHHSENQSKKHLLMKSTELWVRTA